MHFDLASDIRQPSQGVVDVLVSPCNILVEALLKKKKKKAQPSPGYCVVQGHHLMIVCNVGVGINGIALVTRSTLVNFIPFNFQELGHLCKV